MFNFDHRYLKQDHNSCSILFCPAKSKIKGTAASFLWRWRPVAKSNVYCIDNKKYENVICMILFWGIYCESWYHVGDQTSVLHSTVHVFFCLTFRRSKTCQSVKKKQCSNVAMFWIPSGRKKFASLLLPRVQCLLVVGKPAYSCFNATEQTWVATPQFSLITFLSVAAAESPGGRLGLAFGLTSNSAQP